MKLFQEDDETHGVILTGEIGGNAEEKTAAWIKADGVRMPRGRPSWYSAG